MPCFIPCLQGSACRRAGCHRFHGNTIIKSQKFCHYLDRCRQIPYCPFHHPGDNARAGQVIWQRDLAVIMVPKTPKPTAGAPATPLKKTAATPPQAPAPLDNPPILQSLAAFLTEKDRCALRCVSKEVKTQMDSLVPIQTMEVGRWIPRSTQPTQFLKSLTITKKFRERIGTPCLAQTLPSGQGERLAQENQRPAFSFIRALLQGTARSLEHLKIDASEFRHWETVVSLTSLKKLEVLSSPYSDADRLTLLTGLARLEKLENLKLSLSQLPIAMYDTIITSLTQIPRLRSLTLTGMDYLLDEFPIERLAECKNLKHLRLSNGNAPQALSALLLPLEKLSLVSTRIPEIPDEFLRRLMARPKAELPFKVFRFVPPAASYADFTPTLDAILHNAPHLERIVLSGIATAHGDPVDLRFRHLTKLKSLTLGSTPLANFKDFCDSLPDGLECLYIHGTHLTTMTPLVQNLSRLNLWALGINGNPITDMPRLCEALAQHAPNLENFGMTSSMLNGMSAWDCLRSLAPLKHLHHLFLYNTGYGAATRITDREMVELRQKYLKECNRILVTRPHNSKEQKVRLAF
jgi:hypothetical protein